MTKEMRQKLSEFVEYNADYEARNYSDGSELRDALINELYGGMPSADEVRELLAEIESERCYCMEDLEYMEKEYGVTDPDYPKEDEVNELEWQIAHLVLNNAMALISDMAEGEFRYDFTEADKEKFRNWYEFSTTVAIVYGGYTGTIDFVYVNGNTVEDEAVDNQALMVMAKYMYDEVAMKK